MLKYNYIYFFGGEIDEQSKLGITFSRYRNSFFDFDFNITYYGIIIWCYFR